MVTRLGGRPVEHVSEKLDYLVIGANSNPCWVYASYGRKVEAVMALRRKCEGLHEPHRPRILLEKTFLDAAQGQGENI